MRVLVPEMQPAWEFRLDFMCDLHVVSTLYKDAVKNVLTDHPVLVIICM